MWQRDYQARLESWVGLRERCQSQKIADCLQSINHWWQTSPWQPYYLHWDDRLAWPDPWQLLADNVYCDVARALGMLYTVALLERSDCADACMVQTQQGNLVLVAGGKYVMNWLPDSVVNIPSQEIKIQTVLEPVVLASIAR